MQEAWVVEVFLAAGADGNGRYDKLHAQFLEQTLLRGRLDFARGLDCLRAFVFPAIGAPADFVELSNLVAHTREVCSSPGLVAGTLTTWCQGL